MLQKTIPGAPAPGERWKRPQFEQPVRIMGIVEGWVVFRRKGAMPALCHVNQFVKTFVPAPLPPKRKRAPAAGSSQE